MLTSACLLQSGKVEWPFLGKSSRKSCALTVASPQALRTFHDIPDLKTPPQSIPFQQWLCHHLVAITFYGNPELSWAERTPSRMPFPAILASPVPSLVPSPACLSSLGSEHSHRPPQPLRHQSLFGTLGLYCQCCAVVACVNIQEKCPLGQNKQILNIESMCILHNKHTAHHSSQELLCWTSYPLLCFPCFNLSSMLSGVWQC